eukprot:gene342-975_t
MSLTEATVGGDCAPIKFVSEPSASLKCPACENLFTKPVISTICGHTFCEHCVSENEEGNGTGVCCPLDQMPFHSAQIVRNRVVEGQLEELQIYCRHSLIRYDSEEDFVVDENGCEEKIKLSEREEHELTCPYALLPCPNSSNYCGKFRRRDLAEHMLACVNTPCPLASKGCLFLGTQAEVSEHQKSCTFAEAENHENSTKTDVDGSISLAKTVKTLCERVTDLEKDRKSLITQLEQSNSQMISMQGQLENLKQVIEQLRMAQVDVMRSRLWSQSAIDVATSNDYSIQKSFSSSSVASTSPNTSVSIWPTVKSENWKMPFTFKCIGTFRGHSGTIWALTARGNNLFSAGADYSIKVWDVSDIKNSKGCIQTLKGHRDDVHALCTGGGFLYSAGSDKSIRVWSLSSFSLQLAREDAHDNIICAILYTGKYIFSSSLASIKIWSVGTLDLFHSICDLQHWVRALVCDQKREKIYSGSHNTVHIWDANTFALRGKVDHSHGSVYSLGVTSRYLIIGTYNRNTHLYDIDTFRPLKALTGHLGTITGMTPSRSGEFLFTCSCDNTVQVWDIFKLLPIQVLKRHEASVNCVALRGNLLYSGSEDMEIKVYSYYKLSENSTFIN